MFPYEWLTSYEKLSHVDPVKRQDCYRSLTKKTICQNDCIKFRRQFNKRVCISIIDWLRENNVAEVEAVDEARHRFFGNKLKILKDVVSIPGISQRYVLNKVLTKRPEYEFYAPGEPCKYKKKKKCNETYTKKRCKLCKISNKNINNAQQIRPTSSCKLLW